MPEGRCSVLLAGFARREITPALGTPLAGRPTLAPRRAKTIHDPLFVRALYLRAPSAALTVLSVDLTLVTRRLQQAVAEKANLHPDELLACATHTHSATGGYWREA